MTSNYQQQSDEAIKTAIQHDVLESANSRKGNNDLAAYHFEQAKYYRKMSVKLLRKVEK